MSELILFSLNGILVYLLSDWILRKLEKRRGEVMKQRQVVFFAIFLVLITISFAIMKNLLAPS